MVYYLFLGDNDSTGDVFDIIKEIVVGEGLSYIAGYVAFKFRLKYNNSGTQTYKLPKCSEATLDWIQCISNGGLTYPSKEMIRTSEIVDKEFEKFHGAKLLSKEPYILMKIQDLVKKQ